MAERAFIAWFATAYRTKARELCDLDLHRGYLSVGVFRPSAFRPSIAALATFHQDE
jgi:hypothetical protein